MVGSATIEDAVACIDHIVKTAGIDHVGIGSDFDGVEIVPKGLEHVSKMPALTAANLWLLASTHRKRLETWRGCLSLAWRVFQSI
jgi:microsomal dipeptidase-like Zn-dependent dipeptidase